MELGRPLKRAGPPECVKIELPDGRRIITTENSEIRTSGRNHRKIFTKNLFMNVLDQMNTVEIDKDKYNEVVLFKKESMYI